LINAAKIKPISAKAINTMPISGFMQRKTTRDRWRFAPYGPYAVACPRGKS